MEAQFRKKRSLSIHQVSFPVAFLAVGIRAEGGVSTALVRLEVRDHILRGRESRKKEKELTEN